MHYFKVCLLVLVIAFAGGCSDRDAGIIAEEKLIISNLESSNRTIDAQTRNAYAALAARFSEPYSKSKAEEWQPKAEKIKRLSDDCYQFLDSIKAALLSTSGMSSTWKGDSVKDLSGKSANSIFDSIEKENALQSRIRKYEAGLINADEEMKKTFEHTFRYADFSIIRFHDLTVSKALLLLTLLQNNVRVNENMLSMFCLAKVPYMGSSGVQIYI